VYGFIILNFCGDFENYTMYKLKPGRILFIILILVVSFIALNQQTDQVKIKTLGTDKFSTVKWLSGSPTMRGKMLYDLIKNHNPIGKTYRQLQTLLGPSTIYYHYDGYLSYRVGPNLYPGKYPDTDIIVFSSFNKNQIVTEYKFVRCSGWFGNGYWFQMKSLVC